MKLKKETKHTCVYEAVDETAIVPVRSVYIDKVWLVTQAAPDTASSKWPTSIELTVKVQ